MCVHVSEADNIEMLEQSLNLNPDLPSASHDSAHHHPLFFKNELSSEKCYWKVLKL